MIEVAKQIEQQDTDLGAMIQSCTGNAAAQKSFGSQYFGGANQWYINNFGGFNKMSIEVTFNKRNSELQQKIELEIEKVKVGQSKKNMVQLQTILTELQKSNTQKNVILSYPRIIVDSWDYSDQLGMELLELAELYRKM